MDTIQLSSFNKSTSCFMFCHGSAILFIEVWYAGCMVLELMFQIYVISSPSSAILFKEIWYANYMVMGLMLHI
jgi:hypothetical protein